MNKTTTFTTIDTAELTFKEVFHLYYYEVKPACIDTVQVWLRKNKIPRIRKGVFSKELVTKLIESEKNKRKTKDEIIQELTKEIERLKKQIGDRKKI